MNRMAVLNVIVRGIQVHGIFMSTKATEYVCLTRVAQKTCRGHLSLSINTRVLHCLVKAIYIYNHTDS